VLLPKRDSLAGRRRVLSHRGLLFWFGASATSDAEKKVLTGGELTVIEAVDPRVW